jgi:uridine phosphorylase
VARYLRPTAPIAANVLFPADPGLAMTIAQRVMAKPRMANHHHGLWGYTGRDAGGRELTVQASGIGGPSAAAVLVDLADHGARSVLRLGRCAALSDALAPGDAVVVTCALGSDGISRELGVARARPDPSLTQAAVAAIGGRMATVVSSDLAAIAVATGPPAPGTLDGAAALDLETAAVLAVGDRLGLAAAAVLVVADEADDRAGGAATDSRLAELAPALAAAF